MSINISVPDIQDVAVRCVSAYYNDGIPLNQSLAKEASDRGLSGPQVERCLEATNTLGYLKSIEVSKDRTSEFPLAEYGEVIKLASVPESLLKPVEKKAAVEISSVKIPEVNLLKQAEDSLAYSFPQLSPKEQAIHLYKYGQTNARILSNLQENLEYLGLDLVKQAKVLKLDPQGLEHLSATSIEDVKFEKVASLVFGPGTKRKDYAQSGMFKSAQISAAQNFVDSYLEAEKLFEEVEYRKRTHEKIAFFLPALMSGLRAVGSRVGSIGKAIGSGIKSDFAGSNGMTQSIARGVTRGVAAPVKATVVGTAKTVGRGVAKAGKATVDYAKTGLQNAAAGTKIGQDLGIPKVQVNPASLKTKAAIFATGGAVLDASIHTPKVDPAKDMSGDVWKALNN